MIIIKHKINYIFKIIISYILYMDKQIELLNLVNKIVLFNNELYKIVKLSKHIFMG